jgi:hypothetical protein
VTGLGGDTSPTDPPASEAAADQPSGSPGWVARARREGRALLELFTLSGFAVAQPLLDLFGRASTHVAFRGADRTDIVVFGLALVLGPPLVLWLAEVVVGLVSSAARRVVHLVVLGVLAAVLVAQVARDLPVAATVLAASVAGALAALAVARSQAARTWLSFAALAPPVFLGLFLTTSSTSGLFASPDAAALDAGIGNPVPVVLVVFDELPLSTLVDASGELDRDLYPNLAGLADDAHWFRNATTPSTSTWHAVPSLATGRSPVEGSAPNAGHHPENLFTLLGGVYELNVVESATRLCPPDLCEPAAVPGGGARGLLRDAARVLRARLPFGGDGTDPVAGLVEGVEGVEPGHAHGDGDGDGGGDDGLRDLGTDQPPRFRAVLDGIADDGPALHYLHILLPHVPFRHLPDGTRYPHPDPDPGRDGDDRVGDPWLTTLERQRHVLQMAYTDRLLGDLLTTLRDREVYDEALVIVTADHGIAFQPDRPIRGLDTDGLIDDELAAQLMWVPLLVKEPGQQEGTVRDGDVTLLDVVPTVADVLDLELPWPVEGRSVLGADRPAGTKTLFKSEVNPFYVTAGEPYEIDAATGWDLVVGSSVEAFMPDVGDRWRPWRIGPGPELVGAPADEVSGRLVPVEVELADPGPLGAVDRSSGTVPALVRGRLAGVAPGTPLAVVVNGTVAATAPAMADGGDAAVAAMVPEWVLHDGANEVTVHRIQGEP